MEEVFVPASGMAMEEVVLSEWLKQPGEQVEAGEPIALVETDKSTVELSGERGGRLSRHLVAAGARVRGGATVAYLLADGEHEPGAGEDTGAEVQRDAGVAPAARAEVGSEGADAGLAPGIGADDDALGARVPGDPGAGAPQPALMVQYGAPADDGKDASGRHLLSPRQRRLAMLARAGVAPGGGASDGSAAGESAGGRRAGDGGPGERPAADSSNRRATAQLVSESWRTVPHFSVGSEVRAEGLLAALARARVEGVAATATDLLLRAFALALEDEGERPDVGLAVATQWGVLIPVVRAVTSRSLADLAAARRAAVDRARLRRLGSADATAPFATLSNLGPQGVRWFNGVLPLGQVALLTVGAIGPRPAVEGRGLVVAQMFDAVLTADHRRYDGVDSARLLTGFASHLQAIDAQAPAGGEEWQ